MKYIYLHGKQYVQYMALEWVYAKICLLNIDTYEEKSICNCKEMNDSKKRANELIKSATESIK